MREVERLKGLDRRELEEVAASYDNRKVLAKAFKAIMERLSEAASKGVLL